MKYTGIKVFIHNSKWTTVVKEQVEDMQFSGTGTQNVLLFTKSHCVI